MRALMRSAVLLTTASVALSTGVATAAAASLPRRWRGRCQVFPFGELTVRDRTQLTARRVNLSLPDCTARPTGCNTVRLLN